MKLPFKKGDPIADVQAAIDKLGAQRIKLVDRSAELSGRLDEARSTRRAALISGNLDEAAQAAVDKAFADAAEALVFVKEEIKAVAGQLDEATVRRDTLKDAASRAELAADAERRAVALDSAAGALASAARDFSKARVAMTKAITDHGIRFASMTGVDGSASVWQLGQPIVMAAVRLAAPGALPLANGLGEAHSDDPLVAMRRAQSGRLRDHSEDLLSGRVPAAELPRPGSTTPAVEPSGPRVATSVGSPNSEPMARTVFAVPFLYISTGSTATLQGEPGDNEVPLRVARKAEDLELAFPPDSPEGRAIVARLKASGGQSRARPRTYIDTSEDDSTLASASRTVGTKWAVEPDPGRQA